LLALAAGTDGLGADDVAVAAPGLVNDDVALGEAGLAAAPKVGLVAVEEEEGEAGFTEEARGLAVTLLSADFGEDEVDWVKTDGMVTEEGLLEVAAGFDGVDDVAVVAAGLVTGDEAVVEAGLVTDDDAVVVAGFEATEEV
jgi:hypothetical protein